jgi:hypothetical protein
MKLDVMNTQTGGEGETIQATNPTPETPKDFDVNVKPVQSDPPPSSPVIQQTIVDAPKPVVNEVALEEIQKPKGEDVGYVDWFSEEVIHSTVHDELEQANADVNSDLSSQESMIYPPKITNPRMKGLRFITNGYNKVYNDNDEIWMEGEFKNGQLWDGKVYDYDADGILQKVRIFKTGRYHSDGQL